jgi:hypothetical protein
MIRSYICPRCGRLLTTYKNGSETKHGTLDGGECKEEN